MKLFIRLRTAGLYIQKHTFYKYCWCYNVEPQNNYYKYDVWKYGNSKIIK